MTVEELQAKILDLEKELNKEKTEKENLATLKDLSDKDAKKLKEDNERLRDVNMQYFLQITSEPPKGGSQDEPEDNEDQEDIKPLDELLKEL